MIMWCWHQREVQVVNPTPYQTRLVHRDGSACSGRKPR